MVKVSVQNNCLLFCLQELFFSKSDDLDKVVQPLASQKGRILKLYNTVSKLLIVPVVRYTLSYVHPNMEYNCSVEFEQFLGKRKAP
jgi:hypothetical protein